MQAGRPSDCLDLGEGPGDLESGRGQGVQADQLWAGGRVCTHECLRSPEVVCAHGVGGPPAGQGGEAGEKAGPWEGRPCASFVARLQSAARNSPEMGFLSAAR